MKNRVFDATYPLTVFLLLSIAFLCSCKTVKDIDDNSYSIVKIGNQKWLSENLKVTKFNDGTIIPNIVDDLKWSQTTTPAYCRYDNAVNDYGCLYNVNCINMTKEICPTGWTVPNRSDWNTLINYLGNGKTAGAKLMEKGTSHWDNDYGASNESGFTALGNGFRIKTGRYTNIKKQALWWTSENSSADNQIISIDMGIVGLGAIGNGSGIAIRCIKE